MGTTQRQVVDISRYHKFYDAPETVNSIYHQFSPNY